MKPGATWSSVAKTRRRLWEEPVRGTGAGDADGKGGNDPAPLWQVGRGLPEAGAAGALGAVLPEVPGDRAADGESGGAGADAAALPARGEAAPAEEPGKRGAFPAHRASSFRRGLPLSNLASKTPPFWVVFFHYFLGVCLQELQTRLSDEIGKLRSFISSRCSGDRSQNNERSSCELEVRG